MKAAKPERIPALVAAGGRIGGEFARAAGTSIKALAPFAGRPLIARALDALHAAPHIGPVCVVGPQEIQAALDPADLWEAETDTALGNALAGIRRLGNPARLLLCGSDLPLATPDSVEDFLARAAEDSDIALALVDCESYLACYPDGRDAFVRLRGGRFTAGSVFLVRPQPILANQPLIERLFNARKSQVRMAAAIGLPTLAKFAAGRLSVSDLEARISKLTGCRCRAVWNCGPDLAFDIDSLPDLRCAERWTAETACGGRAGPKSRP